MNIEYFLNNWKNAKEEDISFSEDEWIEISSYEYLPEEFIEKYAKEVDWYCISIYQSLSWDFILNHQDKISHPDCLKKYFQLRHRENSKYWKEIFSIHTNNSYGLSIYWIDKMNIRNIPSNIVFSEVL